VGLFLTAATLLSVERISYIWISREPEAFREMCGLYPRRECDPVDALEWLFCGFKVLQIAVFIWWCASYGDGVIWPPAAAGPPLVAGVVLIAAGQALNVIAFRRLGRIGVFYGGQFGHPVSWCRAFPYSVLAHPQYVGAVLSIWGFFLAMRFPHADWYALPALETLYYALGAKLEADVTGVGQSSSSAP
jgi:methylene-fatty-acyl-phospholipid synthase